MVRFGAVSDPQDNAARFGAKMRELSGQFKSGWAAHKKERLATLRPWLNEQFIPRLSDELHAGLTKLLRAGLNMAFKSAMSVDVPAVVVPPTPPPTPEP